MSDAEDTVVDETEVDDEWSKTPAAAFATTAHESEIPADANPDLLRMTNDEISALKVLSWGDSVHRETCDACGTEMIFERHPADWPWHPGDPNDGTGTHVRVKIECPKCGHMQFTDGIDEVEYNEELLRAYMAKAREDVQKKLMEENGGRPVSIQDIRGGDSGGGADKARSAAPPQ